jgi:hypothetical protein
VIPVHQFMPQALAEVLRKAPESPEKIAFAWRAAVGTAVANVTSVELKGRVLQVRAKGPEWRREIERSAGVIRSRLNALLGEDAVRGLNVTLA